MSSIRVVNLAEKFSQIHEFYSPRIAGEINEFHVKLAKLKGEFMWHHHEHEDEMFLVFAGTLRIKVREAGVEHEHQVRPGEFIIIPCGVEHLPSSDDEAHILLLEPNSALNTGTEINERTRAKLEAI